MLILLMLALAASDGGAQKAPSGAFPAQAAVLAAESTAWFQPEGPAFGSTLRIWPNPRSDEKGRSPSESTDLAAMDCRIRVIKADPKFDAKIAQPAPPISIRRSCVRAPVRSRRPRPCST